MRQGLFPRYIPLYAQADHAHAGCTAVSYLKLFPSLRHFFVSCKLSPLGLCEAFLCILQLLCRKAGAFFILSSYGNQKLPGSVLALFGQLPYGLYPLLEQLCHTFNCTIIAFLRDVGGFDGGRFGHEAAAQGAVRLDELAVAQQRQCERNRDKPGNTGHGAL